MRTVLYRMGQKSRPLRKLDFCQIKISPTFWTLMKIKVTPFDSQTINESHGITFIFMGVQRVGEILIWKKSNFLSGSDFWPTLYCIVLQKRYSRKERVYTFLEIRIWEILKKRDVFSVKINLKFYLITIIFSKQ